MRVTSTEERNEGRTVEIRGECEWSATLENEGGRTRQPDDCLARPPRRSDVLDQIRDIA